ncbi:MAG: hypothetical protein CMB80_26975 [Flammeovirgaceae bacterium]|nr:hypothetical protein [Flammeovirgaceae bacterium]MBR09628.1 hypothetical protein [Rickettsiales bacterium]HCX21778.1 hypothetical protein [Cytophagales bacterium]|tara:strand:- start:15 stop:482 length:468 start_codon:yes stop_codon:yes gene_type:complete
MKKALLILIAGVITLSSFGQNKVKEKDITDKTWKLVINIDEELDEAKKEAEEEDSFLAEVIVNSVSGMVSGILNELEIYMEFRANGEVKVTVEAFGEREVEYSEWSIDSRGRLRISDTDRFQTDDDDYWLMEDGVLVSFEDDGELNENVYLVHIE